MSGDRPSDQEGEDAHVHNAEPPPAPDVPASGQGGHHEPTVIMPQHNVREDMDTHHAPIPLPQAQTLMHKVTMAYPEWATMSQQ